MVRLEGGKPWGFTLQGGADFRSPLKIGKVTPGGKAAAAGLVAGDYILTINDTSWEGLKHVEAQQLVVSAADHVVLKCTKHMPSIGLQVPKTPQTPMSVSFSYGNNASPAPTTTPLSGATEATSPIQAGAAPQQGGTSPLQGGASPVPTPVSGGALPVVLTKPPPPPTVKKTPMYKVTPTPTASAMVAPTPNASATVAPIPTVSATVAPTSNASATVAPMHSRESSAHYNEVHQDVSPVESDGGDVKSTNVSHVENRQINEAQSIPTDVEAQKPGKGEEVPLDKRETLDAMMSHIEDLVSGLVVGPSPAEATSTTPQPPSEPSPPSTTSPALSEPLTQKPKSHQVDDEKIHAAASVMVTKEPGWYKQMLHSIHQTSGDEVFVEDSNVPMYDERGLKIRKPSVPHETPEASKSQPRSTAPRANTKSTSTSSSSQTSSTTSAKPRPSSASAKPTAQQSSSVAKEAVLSASKKPTVMKAANSTQMEHSKDYWKQKEDEAAAMETQKRNDQITSRKTSITHTPKTIHPLLASEIPQDERKSVSPDRPQQSVFDRIEPEKLNKALESSQLMGKLEKEGVPSTMVAAIAAEHKETAVEDKQMVREKKLPPPPAKKAKALYNFEAKTPKELGFKKGSVIDLTHTVDDNWFEGLFEGKKGIFPKAYVKLIPDDDEVHEPADIPTQFGIAKYDFNGQTLKELSFKKGDIVSILRKVDANWLEGTLNEKKGIFPMLYVELAEESGSSPTSPAVSPSPS